MTLPTIPESIYAAAWRRWLQSGEDDCRPLLAQCINAVWPELHALAVASLPAPEPAPVVLPDREAIVRAIWGKPGVPRGEAADAVLALLAETVTPWKPVEPGTVIKAGTRYRVEWCPNGYGVTAVERTNTFDITVDPTDPSRYSIDHRTVPADPDADLIHTIEDIDQSLHGAPDGTWGRGFLDALAAAGLCIEPKPVTGPLSGAR